MASPYLEIPDILQNQNQKEVTHNQSIDLLDRAINQITTKIITADDTFTTTETRQNTLVVLEGTPGSPFNVDMPDTNERRLAIQNDSDSDATIRNSASELTGSFLVAKGSTADLHYDGTEFRAITSQANPQSSTREVWGFFSGKPTDGQTIFSQKFAKSAVIPVSASGSQVAKGVAETTQPTVVDLQKNGMSFGSVEFNSGAVVDTNFENVVLLSHLNGVDTDTYAEDSSRSQHVLTFVGNAQLDRAQKQFGTASLLLDGTGDEVTVPDSADFDLGAGEFTIECWYRAASTAAGHTLVSQWGTSGNFGWLVTWDQGFGGMRFLYSTDGTNFFFIDGASFTPTIGQWYHITVTRDSSNDVRIFIDGTQSGSTTTAAVTINNSTQVLSIGSRGDVGSEDMNGHLDDVRITKNVARYTADFSAPGDQFPDEEAENDFAKVEILAPFDGADAATTSPDLSYVGRTLTFNGNAQLDTAQAKFGPSSLLLDGTGDYVSAPDSADWHFAAGEFTVECWVRFNTFAATVSLVSQWDFLNGSKGWILRLEQSTPQIEFFYSLDGTNQFSVVGAVSISTGVWYHVAADRDSAGDIRVYLDGAVVGGPTNDTGSLFDTAEALRIGARDAGPQVEFVDGWIDDVRITKGVGRYGGPFTPRTLAFPRAESDPNLDTNILLLPFDGNDTGTLTEDKSASDNTITFVGDAQLDTAQQKFGPTACLFDGTGDVVTVPDDAAWAFAGDFTVEFWVRWATDPGTGLVDLISQWIDDGTSNDRAWLFQLNNNSLDFLLSEDGTTTATTVSNTFNPVIDTWYHLAVAREGTTIRVFIDGVLQVTTGTNGNAVNDSAEVVRIGAGETSGVAGIAQELDGWIDDVRISDGLARYTATFQAPRGANPLRSVSGGEDRFIVPVETSFVPGDLLTAVGPTPADATLEDITLNFLVTEA